jgi:amino acid transporter
MGGFSSFALSFSVISVLTGIFATYVLGLERGGPFGLVFGWLLVAAGTMLVAVAMAELASAFPTAGALYHWSALFGGRGWGWVTGMLNLVGQVAIVGAIDLACAQALAGAFAWSRTATYGAFAAILVSHGALNVVSIRRVAVLNDTSAVVHIVGVVGIVTWLLAFGHPHPARTLLGGAGHGVLGFTEALVVGMWTMTGFDASAHVSEETTAPELRAPRGIVTAVSVSAVAGLALVVALALRPDAPRGVTALVVGAMWCCGLSSVTSASRMLFALARDGGVPGAERLRSVSTRLGTPNFAIGVATVMPFALVMATAPFKESVFLAIATLATTALYASYALPIALGALARSRGAWRRLGPWNVASAGMIVAWSAVAWSVVVLMVSSLADPLSAKILVGICTALGALWFGRVEKTFVGPKVSLAALERTESRDRSWGGRPVEGAHANPDE